MASRLINFWSMSGYILDGTIRLLSDPIKVALLASTYDPVAPWTATTALLAGAYRQPTAKNSHYYQVATAGTTDATEPVTWPTDGGTVVDGTITWQDMGTILPFTGATDTVWADVVGHEVTGTGYSSGGAVVGNVDLDANPSRSIVYGDNVEWLNSTITARYSVRYMDATVNGIVKPLIACTLMNDAPADVSTDNATFAYNWSANGIHRHDFSSGL